jgi:hypothetical protein
MKTGNFTTFMEDINSVEIFSQYTYKINNITVIALDESSVKQTVFTRFY